MYCQHPLERGWLLRLPTIINFISPITPEDNSAFCEGSLQVNNRRTSFRLWIFVVCFMGCFDAITMQMDTLLPGEEGPGVVRVHLKRYSSAEADVTARDPATGFIFE